MPDCGIADQPGVGHLQRLGERAGRDAPDRRHEQDALQRLPGAQPVGPAARRRGQHGQLRLVLEPGIAGRPGPGRVKSRTGVAPAGVAWRQSRVGDALTVPGTARPTGPARRGRHGWPAAHARRPGRGEQPDDLLAVREMQHGALEPGRLGQLGQDARWHRPAAERAPVGAPRGNGRVQLDFLGLRLARPGQPHRRQQQRLAEGRESAGPPAGGRPPRRPAGD